MCGPRSGNGMTAELPVRGDLIRLGDTHRVVVASREHAACGAIASVLGGNRSSRGCDGDRARSLSLGMRERPRALPGQDKEREIIDAIR